MTTVRSLQRQLDGNAKTRDCKCIYFSHVGPPKKRCGPIEEGLVLSVV